MSPATEFIAHHYVITSRCSPQWVMGGSSDRGESVESGESGESGEVSSLARILSSRITISQTNDLSLSFFFIFPFSARHVIVITQGQK